MVPMAARPIAPPTCCPMLMPLDATPASCGRDARDDREGERHEQAAHARADQDHPRQQVGPVVAGGAQPRQPQKAGAGEQRPDHEQRPHADAGDEDPGHEGAHDDDRDGEGHPREAGAHRTVAVHRLDVDGEEEEHGEHPRVEQQHHEVGARPTSRSEQMQRQLGMAGAALDRDEDREQRHGGHERHDRRRTAPVRDAVATGGGVDQTVDQQRETGAARDDARHVEAQPRARRRHQGDRRQDEHGDADRHVDEEHPAPRRVGREDAAEQQADGAAGAAHGGVDAEGPVARRPGRKRRGDQRQGGRRGERAARALHRPRREDPPLAGGQAAGERAQREDQHAGHEHPAAAVDVAEPAAEQKEAAEGERVRGDDPLEAGAAEPERPLDVRQGNVHDRGVEHDHELGGRDHDQRQAQSGGRSRRGRRAPDRIGGEDFSHE